MKYFFVILILFASFSFTKDKRDLEMLIPGYQFAQESDSAKYYYWLGMIDSCRFETSQKEWYDFLQKEDGAFYLEKANPVLVNQYIDCWDEHAIVFSSGGIVTLSGSMLSERRVPGYPLSEENSAIFPGDSLVFNWGNKTYKLRAEADVVDLEMYEKNGTWDGIQNYRLFISDGQKEQLFFGQEGFHDSRSEIIFIGDLDNDGKPDLLMSDPFDYETVSLVLYLSTYASVDELVGAAASGGYDTSC